MTAVACATTVIIIAVLTIQLLAGQHVSAVAAVQAGVVAAYVRRTVICIITMTVYIRRADLLLRCVVRRMRRRRYGRVVAVERAYNRVCVHRVAIIIIIMIIELIFDIHRGRAAQLVAGRVLFARRVSANVHVRVLAAAVRGPVHVHEELGRVAASRRLLAHVSVLRRKQGLFACAHRLATLVRVRGQKRVRAQVMIGEYVVGAVDVQIAQVNTVIARVRRQIALGVVFAASVAVLAGRVDQ